jgi:hypothetical protein
VQAAVGCPATIGPAQDVANTGVALDKTMLPPNAVSGQICRFGPAYRSGQLVVPAGALYREQQLDRSTVEHLTSVIDGISTARPPGVTSCPDADGSASIIVISYADTVDVNLWFFDSGCRTLDNGVIGAFEDGNPAFYNDFESLMDRLSPQRP